MRKRQIHAAAKPAALIAMQGPATIAAAEGDAKGPRKFDVLAYTGGLLALAAFELPVVVDLATLKQGKSLVSNLDHKATQRVGNVTAVDNDGKTLKLSGLASAATPYRDEVVASADSGFVWQASIEAAPGKLEAIAKGKSVTVNGQQFSGPIYVARGATLKGFGFVSHGADDDTTVTIAATAASLKENDMDPKLKAFIEAMGFDPETLSADQLAGLTANFNGRQAPAKKRKIDDIIAEAKAEDERREAIANITAQTIADNPGRDDEFITRLDVLANNAIEAGWSVEKFDVEVLRAMRPQSTNASIRATRPGDRLSNKVIEAAIALTGKLADVEKKFDEQTLEAAHQKFPNGIGLKQLMLICAEANGHKGSYASDITIEVQRAAFGMTGPQRQIQASGFSTLNIANILSNNQNKFLREGWNAVDMTPMRIAAIRSVRDFREITTVSLTGGLMFEKVGPAGEIKHGTLGDMTYGNRADTYAIMLAITRQDMINDDLGALTSTPRRIGRGGALKLNDIFWTEFLNNSSFFTSGNNNVSTVDGTVSAAGLDQANVIFTAQTDPDGFPVGTTPKIWLVPTATHTAALQLMNSELLLGSSGPASNVWRGRFRVESSPYMSNSAYTGYSAAASYLLADPSDMPVIEIVALNGRVEPTVETSEADFNTLGVQMRGYSDVGVRKQEYRGGVRLDGTAA